MWCKDACCLITGISYPISCHDFMLWMSIIAIDSGHVVQCDLDEPRSQKFKFWWTGPETVADCTVQFIGQQGKSAYVKRNSIFGLQAWAQAQPKACMNPTVFCHHSPRWISLAFRQDPIYLDGDPFLYMCYHPLWTLAISTPVLITPPIHFIPANICFHWSRATHEPHHQLIHISLIYHVCRSKGWPNPTVPIILERSCGMWWKVRQWRF